MNTMKADYERQIKRLGVLEYGDGEVVKILASEVEEGKFDVWHRADGILDRVNAPTKPISLAKAQQMAVNYVLLEEAKGQPRSKPNCRLQALADKVNGVIHRRNLYHPTGRYINAHVEGGKVLVENLNTGQMSEYIDGEFTDGYGQAVFVVEKGQA